MKILEFTRDGFIDRFDRPGHVNAFPLPVTSALALLLLLGGCAGGSVDPSRYASASCVELNEAMTKTSSNVSRTAITRGRVVNTNVPTWVPGGQRVATAVVDRQTAKIESLQEQERTIAAARSARCGR